MTLSHPAIKAQDRKTKTVEKKRPYSQSTNGVIMSALERQTGIPHVDAMFF
jgi:hypothetical protein